VTEFRHQPAFWRSEKKRGKPAGRRSPFVRVRVRIYVCCTPTFRNVLIEREEKIYRKKNTEKIKNMKSFFFFSWYSRDCARGRDAIEFSTHQINRHTKEKKRERKKNEIIKTRKPTTHKVSFLLRIFRLCRPQMQYQST
jgi:hypothetical protein